MKIYLRKAVVVLAALFLPVGLALAGDTISLQNLRDSSLYGPVHLRKGERVSLGGVTYEIQVHSADRISFKSLANGVIYGPIQVVDGRLGVVGNATYRLHVPQGTVAGSASGRSGSGSRAAPSEPFVPQPPAMPDLIEVPEQQPQRIVKPKDLRALPETGPIFRVDGWLALIDHTPIDWKIDSAGAGDGALERVSLGGGVDWNYWLASVTLSPSVECGDIASGGSGITGASFEDGTGWSIEAGYRRPFLVEGGWKAGAGLRGQIRQDSGDLTVNTVSRSGVTDTNGVVNVVSERHTQSSSIKVRELSLWIDLELSYSEDLWGVYALISIEPVSEYDVSGSIRYGDGSLSLDAERATPLAVPAGGWYVFEQWRFFADLTLGADRRLRIGGGYEF